MKQKLTLLLIALMTSLGAWAETVPVTTASALWSTTGTLGYDGSDNWAVSWTSSNEKVKITCPKNGHIYKNSSQMGKSTFTIWTPGTEMITGFTLTFTSSAASSCTVTSGLVSKTSTGTSNEQTLSISGIFAHFVQITVSGQYANVSSFSIDYTSMPAQTATGYYLIKGNWPEGNYLYANSSNAAKLWKNWSIADVNSLYFDANYVWRIDEYGDYRSLYNVGASRYVSNFTTANSSSTSKSGADVNILDATEFSDAELFVLTDDLKENSLTGAKAYKACSKSSNCFMDNFSNGNYYTGFHNAAHKGNAFLPTRVYKVTFKAADEDGNEVDGAVQVNGNMVNAIYVPASTTLTSVVGSKYFIGGVEKTESEVKTAVSGVTDDNLVVYVTPVPTTITLNFKEGGETVATKTISAKNGVEYDILSTFGFQSRYMTVDPATVTGTAADQNIDVTTTFDLPFTVCSNPATDVTMNRVYYLTLNSKYAKGNQISASLDREDKDYFWTIGGDYINGFTIYNKGQEAYMSNGTTDNSVAAFDGTTSRYMLYSWTDDGFYFKVKGTDKNYLNDRGNKLSTWNSYDIAYYMELSSGYESYFRGSFITVENVSADLSEVYTYLTQTTIGSSFNQYSSTSYTDADRTTALSEALTAYNGADVYDVAAAAKGLWAIKNDMTINTPASNSFLRIKTRHNTYFSNTATSYSGWESNLAHKAEADNTTLFYYDGTNLIDYASGLKVNGANVGSVGGTGKAFSFAESTQTPGRYTVKFNDGSDKFLYAWGSPYYFVQGDASEAPNTIFTLEAVTSLPVTISEVGYATLYSPVALTIPPGITAYVAAEDDGTRLRMTPISDGIIPAECGVVLKGAQGSYNFTTTTGGTATSLLKGDVATISKPADAYYLSNGDSGFGFYKAGSATTLAGFKAYYEEESGGTVKQFIFEDADGIKIMENGQWTMDNANIFNLAGQRMNKLQRGVNIVNGKKIIVK